MVRRFAVAWLLTVLAGISVGISGQDRGGPAGQPSLARGDWPHYTADIRGTKYSPLDQINAGNFNKLEVAWRFKTDILGPRPEYKLEGTPLAINGVLYTTGGTRRSVVALDGRTGELMWAHSLREGRRAGVSPRQLSGRGVSYWTDGRGDDRILYVTTGYRLVALNAQDRLDDPCVRHGRHRRSEESARCSAPGSRSIWRSGEIGLHATPAIAKDVIIVGSSFREGATVNTHNNTKGLVRAFDVRTGKLLWTFNTIPRARRIRQRHLGERFVGGERQHRRLDADHGRRRARARLPAGRNADLGLLRRPSPRQQPVCGEHRLRRSEDGAAQVALPARAPSAVELRHVVRARSSRTSPSTAARSRPSRCPASRRFSGSSIA